MPDSDLPWDAATAQLDSMPHKVGQHIAADCRRCNDRTGQHVQSSTAAGLVLKCGRCGKRSLRAKR